MRMVIAIFNTCNKDINRITRMLPPHEIICQFVQLYMFQFILNYFGFSFSVSVIIMFNDFAIFFNQC